MNIFNINPKNIKTLPEFVKLFLLSDDELKLFLSSKEKNIQRRVIIKKNGDIRRITYPKNDTFRHFLIRLNSFLSNWYLITTPKIILNVVHGFVKGKSIITNAQQHTQKKFLLNVDIKSFFDSITIEKIYQLFLSIGFKKEIASVLAELVTVDGVLATGFSTSPTISNIICTVMDDVFLKVSEKNNVIYTRYADDITFSSNEYITHKGDIEKILNTFSFRINQDKFRLYRRGGPQYVTGLTVVDRRPRLSKKFKRLIRLELYYIKKYGFTDHFTRVLEIAFKKEDYPRFYSIYKIY
jgi:hypothetical protein